MFLRKNWLPLSVFLIVIVMVGLYVLQTRSEKAPIKKIHKAVEVEKPKVEVPVDDTSQGGHFHEDGTWHAGPHENHAETPSTTEVNQPQQQETPSVIAKEDPTAAPKQNPSDIVPTPKTPQEEAEIQRQWRAWSEWENKAEELRENYLQVGHANFDLMPKTAEEAERYQTDKEWQRKVQEATDKYDEALRMLQEHEANRVVPPVQSFREQIPKER